MSAAQGLLSLPNEILLCSIVPDLNLQSLVALSQTCKKFRALFAEMDWQQACYRAGFTRSLIHAARSWRETASALCLHGKKCLGCADHFVSAIQAFCL